MSTSTAIETNTSETNTPVKINGEPLNELPKDLYIPPEALEIFLTSFEGPLDLLLYLIRKKNLDISKVSVLDVTKQYLSYVENISHSRMPLISEYLLMSALLAEIKSKSLLPSIPSLETENGDTTDPTNELIQKLRIYEQFKIASEKIDALPRIDRDILPIYIQKQATLKKEVMPQISIESFLNAFASVLERNQLNQAHQITTDKLTVRGLMTHILNKMQHHPEKTLTFLEAFDPEEGKSGIIVSFLAMMELLKSEMISITQLKPFGPIYLSLNYD